jgi:hypothetical protein
MPAEVVILAVDRDDGLAGGLVETIDRKAGESVARSETPTGILPALDSWNRAVKRDG